MLKKIFLILITIITFSQNLFSDDYYNYGEYPFSGYSVSGFIDTNGKLGEPGKEYIFHIEGNRGFIHRVDTDGDPQRHPNNPDSTGEIAHRSFTLISSHIISNARGAKSSFHVDDSGIYYGPCDGIKRWNFDWSNETTVVSKSYCGETFAINSRTGDFWAGNSKREIYKWDGSQWKYQFTYPNLGGDHHDGMTIANDILFVSDMTSDYISTYLLDKQGNVINPNKPNHTYKYSASPAVENMGFGPNNHIWISSGKVIYEIGGGKLQEELSACTQDLILNGQWQMLSSACDINVTAFKDSVVLKKVADKLIAISADDTVREYYENLGYETKEILELKRGEGFWVRSKDSSIRHKLNGKEETTTIELKRDTTSFIGFPEYNSLDLDEIFIDKPIKEIKYWDENSSKWYQWIPNNSDDSNLTTIPKGHGFYICVADDFNLSLPNLPPIIVVKGDLNITVGEKLSLDASGSYDRDGEIVSYRWSEKNVTLSTNSSLIKDDFDTGWHKIILDITDDDGAVTNKEILVWVLEEENIAPTVNLGEDKQIKKGETLTLSPIIQDEDGYILSYEWKLDNVVVASTSSIKLDGLSVGEHNLSLLVMDDDLAKAEDSIKITVILPPDTTPPVITLNGDSNISINKGEVYNEPGATAIDNVDGNISVTISGTVDTNTVGTYTITYSATDSSGNSASKTRTVNVIDNIILDTTPPVITLNGDATISIVKGKPYNELGATAIDNVDGNISVTISGTVDTNTVGTYTITYSATDSSGNSASKTRTVSVIDNIVPDTTPPVITLNGDSNISINKGEVYNEPGATAIDNVDGNISVTISGTVDTNTVGTYTITYSATDSSGNSASKVRTIHVIDPSDKNPPIAKITSPSNDTKVNFEIDIVGTASDENPNYYTLSFSPVGQNDYTEFARAEDNISNGKLATLDATILKNGIYDIKLTVFDQNGAKSEAFTRVIIKGKAKIGNFSFTVTDFDIKVGGIPVQVNRTYSTLQRFEKYDFTYGWSIDYQNVKVEENIHPGYDWKMVPDGFIGSCFKFDKQHIVNIDLPDGTTESFEFRFERECGHYFAGSFYDAPKLYALNGSEAKLEAIDASDSVAMYSDGKIIDSNTLKPYNPSKYKLTLSNGMVYEIVENRGIKKITSLLGDTLTYNDNGIISSRGESLTFQRDAQNRITKITDLAGKAVEYHYNQNGDLDYVIDQMGNKTEYLYVEGHLLSEYHDPSGLRVAKNFYDDAGRLIKTVDADGNAIEFSHDIDGREEIIKDRLGRTSVYIYDDEGNVLSKTNPMGETTTYTYDDKGNELTVTDALGNTITKTYDSRGNLLTTTDALGNSEITTYNSENAPLSISDKNGNTMNIVYNSYNSPRSITTPSGAKTTYYYDKYGNKIQSINEYNQTTYYEYDEHYIPFIGGVSSKGNLLKETRADGTIIEHTYDESSNLLTTKTTLADGTSTTVSNSYDAFNRVISTTDELGNTTTYEYDARGNKIKEKDAQDRETIYEYNSHNKLIKTTHPDGTTESKTYDAMDNLLSETNQEGETTTYEYDDADRLVKTTYADGTTTLNEYDEAGRLTATIDQNGNKTTYEYDEVGNKTSQTDALGNKTTFTYDAQGNMLTVTDALNHTTTYEYNELNQRVKTIYADGSSKIDSKNISGLPSFTIDELGNKTDYEYDTNRVFPLLNKVTLANGAITKYQYDSQGRKIAQVDALNHITKWTYRPTGELNEEILPNGDKKSFSYDKYGKQTEIIDYAGKSQKFIYNAYDKLVKIEYSDGSSITYDYTSSGRVKTVTDLQGTISSTYDIRGRLKTQTNPNGDTITYSYDGVGNIVKIETATQTITKTYDALNRLKSVTDTQGIITYSYDAIGRQTDIVYPNGITTHYEYDSRDRITKIEHKKSNGDIIQSFTYTLDALGNRIKVVENTGRTVSYEYNSVNQLSKETITNDPNGNNSVTIFAYDLVGNLVSKTVDGDGHTYTYNANDQLIKKDGQTLTYDANGNLIDDGINRYEYDDRNRLIKVITATQTVLYSYDANDNRIAKSMDNKITRYLVDANTPYAQLITESKDDGTEIHYTYGNDLLTNGTEIFLTDALGSTRGLVDNGGVLTDSYIYSPYGKLTNHNGLSQNTFLFTGEQFDKETENYYLRARYYRPSFGRFLSRDSYDGKLIDPLSQNHYLYGGGNPVRYVDPSGHFGMISTGFGVATVSEIFTIPNSTKFLNITPQRYMIHYSKKDILDGTFLIVTEKFTPGHGALLELVSKKLLFLTKKEQIDFINSANLIWGIGFAPNAPLLIIPVQELSFLLLAKKAVMINEINRLMGFEISIK